MRLRTQLALVSLTLLLLPWAGWQLLKQMDALLRQGQAQNLLASADLLARNLERSRSLLAPGGVHWFAHSLARMPRLDGEFSEWPAVEPQRFAAAAGSQLTATLGQLGDSLYLRVQVRDASPQPADAHWARAAQSDHLRLALEGPNGLVELRLANARNGALLSTALDGGPAPLRLSGEWRRRNDTELDVEILLPTGWPLQTLGLQWQDAADGRAPQWLGTGIDPPQLTWPVWSESERAEQWLARRLSPEMRARLIDVDGWVYARAGAPNAERDDESALPWWKQQLWQAMLYDQPAFEAGDRAEARRIESEEVWQALSGKPAAAWRRDAEAPRLLASAAVPLALNGELRGALVLQREHQNLELSDQALSQLVMTSLLAMLAAIAVLLWYAGRLSRRIRALNEATERAISAEGEVDQFLPSSVADEVGDLSRSFARLLNEVGAHQAYLRGLAGKLSHELNTPIAVVRGALENIDPAGLDSASHSCVERALGGIERLSGIVRGMSEATRVEQAIANAEGEDVDLVAMLGQCAESYRPLLAPRELRLDLPSTPLRLHCSPELLVQALDKLIDNARSFCPADGWVRLSLWPAAQGVVVALANSGPRLPEAARYRLFESLVSVRSHERQGGAAHLGLGLFIVKLVAELHAGHAEASDLADGSGVEFSLRLNGMPRRRIER
ncbi:ATP-binding protein [Pseudomarimonas arenosa]|uniref:histidine kinase n=1 Tax=Pseudomarimonas arenosa TaxID=2774145 RepID=A0AAW3ZLD5_9GAMM|nr:ATP-binding protein [Pseudomarimonas arenosa]MBD8525126.1 histidine kinase [Pseudomarimonas arenosa]